MSTDTTTTTNVDSQDPRAQLRQRTADQLALTPYTFPGTEIPIKVRLLAEREVDSAKIEAQRYARKLKADVELDPDFVDREVQRQIVWRSMFEPVLDANGKPHPLYLSDADVRELDTVTVEALFSLYLAHQESKSTLRQLTQEQVDAMAVSARANPTGARVELARLDHASLVRLAHSLLTHLPAEEP